MTKLNSVAPLLSLIISSVAFAGDTTPTNNPGLIPGVASSNGNSSWIVSGSNIYYSPNPEKITIGTVSYSNENGGPSSTCGNYVQNQCNGKTSCTYTGSDTACGVTSTPGQTNYLFITYACGGATFSKHSEAGVAAKIACPGDGYVGIGTEAPEAKLDVKGEVKFGNSSSTCNLTNEGQQRYNSNNHVMEFCDGKSWTGYLVNSSLNDLQNSLKGVQSDIDNLKKQMSNVSTLLGGVADMAPCRLSGTATLGALGIQTIDSNAKVAMVNGC